MTDSMKRLLLLLMLAGFQAWADDAVQAERWCCMNFSTYDDCSITLWGDFESNTGLVLWEGSSASTLELAGAPGSEIRFTIEGTNRRWDWRKYAETSTGAKISMGEYAFTIEHVKRDWMDGAYFNFRDPPGKPGKPVKPVKPSSSFKCHQF